MMYVDAKIVTRPVLVIAFNRPDHLRVLLNRLEGLGISDLYVAVDGPRHVADEGLVGQVRSMVEEIDWVENLYTNFRDTNLGCGRGVTAAISWFFDEVSEGIILEDDIVPAPSFFDFCSELLDRYRDDERVFAISGGNIVPSDYLEDPDASYRFAQITHVWGWATWRRSWDQHRLQIDDWYRTLPVGRLWESSGRSIPGLLFWAGNFEAIRRGLVDTWDWPMNLAAMKSGQLTATSNVNLVQNIGFDAQATHTTEGDSGLLPVEVARVPSRPVPVRKDRKAERWTRRNHWNATYLGTLDRLRKLVALKGEGR
jgi:hypothetical protein